jgi:hypothetical protein
MKNALLALALSSVAVGCGTAQDSASTASVSTNGYDGFIEVSYPFSAFQCGSTAPQAVFSATLSRADGKNIITKDSATGAEASTKSITLNKGGKKLIKVKSSAELSLKINKVLNASCALSTPVVVALGPTDTLPTVSGAYSQPAVSSLHKSLAPWQNLWLYELGTTNKSSKVYDLQDVILKVDFQPGNSNVLYPD